MTAIALTKNEMRSRFDDELARLSPWFGAWADRTSPEQQRECARQSGIALCALLLERGGLEERHEERIQAVKRALEARDRAYASASAYAYASASAYAYASAYASAYAYASASASASAYASASASAYASGVPREQLDVLRLLVFK